MEAESTNDTNGILVKPGDVIFNRSRNGDGFVVTSNIDDTYDFVRLSDTYAIAQGTPTHLVAPGDWICNKYRPWERWWVKETENGKLMFVRNFVKGDKITPTGEITWIREQTSSAIPAPHIINETKTYTETTTMNNTKTTAIPIYTPEELREKKISMEDFCVPVDMFSENKIATEKILNSGVPCHEIVSTLRRIVNNCEAFLRLKKMYPVKCGEMNVYIDEIYREARNTLGDLGYEAYSIVPEDLKYDVMYMPTEDRTPNGKPVEPEPCALANSREKEQDPLVERFPMLDFDASDCAKILIKRENDTVRVVWLNRLNDILLKIKRSAESGCRGTVYDDIPFSYFAWTHNQMCTDEEKEVKYLMRELEQRGFKVKVLSVPSRGEEREDSNICLGIEW